MKQIYFICGACCIVFFAYMIGRGAGRASCNYDIRGKIILQQRQITKTLGDVNDKVVRTSVSDIRRILREKYTIAE